VPHDTVDLWWATTSNVDLGAVASAMAQLGSYESAMASRFLYQVDRTRYVVSHALLDFVLARYDLAGPLDRTCSRCGDLLHGKPRVEGPIDFSLAHAGTWAVVAVVGPSQVVGVDLEAADASVSASDIKRLLGVSVTSLGATTALAAW
jgi:phosphopantetheinyl transferase